MVFHILQSHMSFFSPPQVAQLLSIQKSFSGMFLSDSIERINTLTRDLPVLEREQFRLFAFFCLYKHLSNVGRLRQSDRAILQQIQGFHKRLFEDISAMSQAQVEKRCREFASASFVSALEMVAQGCPELQGIVELVKCKPSGRDFLQFVEGNKGAEINVRPEFLHFLPKKFSGRLIAGDEYAQVKLY